MKKKKLSSITKFDDWYVEYRKLRNKLFNQITMKKLLIIFAVLFTSCSQCLLSQIPPQKIYAGSSCQAPLPDYRLKITASDNCEIASFTQTPAPGYLLTPTNKVTTVIVKATDASGNYKQLSFTVSLLDTIKPVLTIDPSLLTYQTEQINNIYDYGDRLLKYTADNLVNQSWLSNYPGLKEKLSDSSYYKKDLVVLSYNTKTGDRGRFITFADSVAYFYK